MNRTEERLEERLRDALGAVAGTLRPGDVPPPEFAERRRARAFRRTTPMVAAAATLAVTIGAGMLAGDRLGGTDGAAPPLAPASPSTAPDGTTPAHVSVYLCVRGSDNLRCGKRDASKWERQMIEKRLKHVPFAVRVQYESRQEAYVRFKSEYAGSPGFEESTAAGDVRDSFRVWLRDTGNEAARVKHAAAVQQMLTGLPGVDEVVLEGTG
ncbi:permease-like cell division protein FtsX [Actinomadura algeriensis]|uniref:FtsX extracellular domain-containing protein n=1 Tax=Actinomadura algeriensis TaxID=1679523 RepID=A0ABR9JQP7_9ACTN|nr:permease-like cell division protein FtsX [Actinomadura algeriensis]MBE1532895.1 hypothetical protein [Actinomadura algeriensis]